jgi:hypothetical protein
LSSSRCALIRHMSHLLSSASTPRSNGWYTTKRLIRNFAFHEAIGFCMGLLIKKTERFAIGSWTRSLL